VVVVGRAGGFGTGARRDNGDWCRVRTRRRLACGEGVEVSWRKELAPIDLSEPDIVFIVAWYLMSMLELDVDNTKNIIHSVDKVGDVN
jgi:hypothetical protein